VNDMELGGISGYDTGRYTGTCAWEGVSASVGECVRECGRVCARVWEGVCARGVVFRVGLSL
jgi:hypothetical protein